MTHAPESNSQVVDKGDNSAIPVGLEFDQRGVGYPRIEGSSVDLGALELSIFIFRNGFEDPD